MAKTHGLNSLQGLDQYCSKHHHYHDGDRFGRLFPDLSPLYTNPRVLEKLGRLDGPMDEKSNRKVTESVEVGQVFFGQFVDHDITLDLSSSFDSINEPSEISNARTPTLDLDCVYGAGPEASRYLFHNSGAFAGVKLITGADIAGQQMGEYDLPRVNGAAIIGDFRNDENRILSQIQLAMIRFHNQICEQLKDEHEGKALYEEARKLTTWHYQWAVVHDFLKKTCGAGVINRILSEGRKWYKPKRPFIPVEFSVAAYRFGHAMVPMKIQTRKGGNELSLFGSKLGFGFAPLENPEAVVDMHEIFDTYEPRHVARAGRMDHKLSTQLLNLPVPISGSDHNGPKASLAARNMIRGQSFLLPSGELVADCLGRPKEEIDKISTAALADAPDLQAGTPLWYYILREADLVGRETAHGSFEPGEGLGPVGATIVAETIIGLIELDARSWLGANRDWSPKSYANGNTEELSTVGNIMAFANEDVTLP